MSRNVKLILLTSRCKIPSALKGKGNVVCPSCFAEYSVSGLVLEKIGCNWVPISETPGWRRTHIYGCSNCEHIFDSFGEDRRPDRRDSGGIFFYEEEILLRND